MGALLLCLIGAQGVFANVYASGVVCAGVTNGAAGSITYWLNENADSGVTIDIVSWEGAQPTVRTLTGPTTKGKHVVTFDGKDGSGTALPVGQYGVKITASDNGYSLWTQISSSTNATCMYSGQDVAINNNSESPAFGRIYISNATTGTPTVPTWYTGGSLKEGLYAFNPDQTYLEGLEGVFGYCTANATIGYPFPDYILNVQANVSTSKGVTVDADDNVYLTDYANGREYLWRSDAAFSASSLVSLFTALSDPLVPAEKGHGNVIGCQVVGSGADRILYYCDEDIIAAQGHAFMKAELGNKTSLDTPTMAGVEVVPPPAGSWVNLGDIAVDSAGNYYAQVYRWYTASKDALWKFAPDGTTVLWQLDNATYYTIYYGVGLDEARNRVYIVQYQNQDDVASPSVLYQIDMTTGAEISSYAMPPAGAVVSRGYRGCNVDAVGNVYVISSLVETWLVLSPPDGPNSFVTWKNQPGPPAPLAVQEKCWTLYQ